LLFLFTSMVTENFSYLRRNYQVKLGIWPSIPSSCINIR